MAKIGRNDPCPCGSGKKYKKCCAGKNDVVLARRQAAVAARLTLMSAVETLQKEAAAARIVYRELGVFFFTTAKGDAWVLEMTDQDAVQVAAAGEAMAPPIDESPETIEINWSHTFALKDKALELTAYADKSSFIIADAPAKELNAAIRRMKKRFSEEQLNQVHVESPEISA